MSPCGLEQSDLRPSRLTAVRCRIERILSLLFPSAESIQLLQPQQALGCHVRIQQIFRNHRCAAAANRDRSPGYGGKAQARQAALDEAPPRHPCARPRRRADNGARQPLPRLVATTSIYLHSDEVKRERQMHAAFGLPAGR
jgi:hypothetical protein